MMTLEEVWENLRQNPETKATMEEVDKSYKLFKKIENLIVADLEAKLEESEETIRLLKMSNDALREDNLDLSYNQFDNVYETATEMSKGWESQYQEEIAQLKQQIAEKDGELHQIYSHLGVEAFGEDIHEQALKEIAKREKKLELRKSLCKACQSIDNQTAIAELEKVLNFMKQKDSMGFVPSFKRIKEQIDQQIKSLKGGNR